MPSFSESQASPGRYFCTMSEPVKRPPVSIYAEATPNPATMRFVSSRILVNDGRLLEFRSPEEPVGVSPLAEKIFKLPFVTGVFLSSNFITVTKNNVVTWDLVQLELREYIQEYLNTDGRVVYEDAPAQALADANERASTHAAARSPEDEKIIRVLEEYIRPAVEGDGGHIAFKSFEDGLVTVSLRGSCSGCPSSMVTLKQGIENLLKHEVPGVREVVAEEL
jgi:Fe-S cluster biogenesis protein NfuA